MAEDDQNGTPYELVDGVPRPRTRADCLPGGVNDVRPCPWYGCKYHLGLVIDEKTGAIKLRNVDDLAHTCQLDVAEIGAAPGSGRGIGVSVAEVAELSGMTEREALVIEARARGAAREEYALRGMAPDDRERLSWANYAKREAKENLESIREVGLESQEECEKPLADDDDQT